MIYNKYLFLKKIDNVSKIENTNIVDQDFIKYYRSIIIQQYTLNKCNST